MEIAVKQHYRKEEEPLLEELGEQLKRAQDEYRPILTRFLNPREQFILEQLKGRFNDVKVAYAGGYPEAERKRALLYPEYYQPVVTDFELALIEVDYPIKFAQLSHSQVLGSLVNIGLERQVLGDIITDGLRYQFVTQANLASYFCNQVQAVGKVRVRLNEVALEAVVTVLDEWQAETMAVTTIRLDAVISHAYHVSRQVAKEMVKQKRVQVNWMMVEKPDYVLAQADIISVRGFGRIRLDQLMGPTKKAKQRLAISILKKKK